MDILSLKLVITDSDLVKLGDEFMPEDAPVDDLKMVVDAGVIQVSGNYPTRLLSIPFQTSWEPVVDKGRVRLRLGSIRVVGLPATMLRGLFLSGFRHVADQVPGATVEDDTLVFDVDRLLAARGIPLRSNLKTIRCEPGRLTVEA